MMFDLLMLVLGTLAGLAVNYSRQTSAVANANYLVTKPPCKVSVIIPTLNEEAHIENTLLDIKNQNVVLEYPELFEIIVVDNESTDNTVEIATDYADKIILTPKGKLTAKNAGVSVADGEICILIDADNRLQPNLFNLVLSHFQDPTVVAVGGVCLWTDKNLLQNYLQIQTNSYHRFGLYTSFANIHGGMQAVRRDAYFAVGGYNQNINQQDRTELSGEEEFGFCQRLQSIGKVIIDDRATVYATSRADLECEKCSQLGLKHHCDYCEQMTAGERF